MFPAASRVPAKTKAGVISCAFALDGVLVASAVTAATGRTMPSSIAGFVEVNVWLHGP